MSANAKGTKQIQRKINIAKRIHISLTSVRNERKLADNYQKPTESMTDRKYTPSRAKASIPIDPFKVITNLPAQKTERNPSTSRTSEDRCMPLGCLTKRNSIKTPENKDIFNTVTKISHRRYFTTLVSDVEEKKINRRHLQQLSKNYVLTKESLEGYFVKDISNLVVRTDHKCIN